MRAPGNTPIVEYPAGRELGFEWVGIKDERQNPTGTFKDRRSAEAVARAQRAGVRKLVVISAGNAAYSLGSYGRDAGIEVVPVIDERNPASLKATLRDLCPGTIETDLGSRVLTSEDLIAMARRPGDGEIWDVSNGLHEAYGRIVEELPQDNPPDAIVVPCGSGEAMVGVADAVAVRKWPTKVLGVGSFHVDKLRTIFTPYYVRLAELSCRGSHVYRFGQEAEERIAAEAPGVVEAEPAARLVFGVLKQIRGDYKRVLLVNSGRGKILDSVPDHDAWQRLQSRLPLDPATEAALERWYVHLLDEQDDRGCYPWGH